jgi:hypothetical protein
MSSLTSWFYEFQPKVFLESLVSGQYYDYLFPFLLIYALFYTILSSKKISLFQNNSIVNKAGIFVISFSISLFSIYFELPSGYTIGKLLMLLFPNISTITIVILGLYIVGSMMGKNFFSGAFDKRKSAFGVLTIAGISLGLVIFYVGIAFGMWDYMPFDEVGVANVVLAVIFIILAIVFFLIHMQGYGFILAIVTGKFIADGGDEFILNYFIDPAMFVLLLIVFLLTWMNSDGEDKRMLKRDMQEQKESLEAYKSRNGGVLLEDYKSRKQDISDSGFQSNQKKWDKNYPGESWEN